MTDVMGALKQENGQGPKMNSVQIIQKSTEGQLGTMPFNQFLNGLRHLLQNPNNKLLQIGNSVFLIKQTVPGEVEVHTFSAENPQQLVENYKGLAKVLKNQGIKKARSYADSPAYARIAKMSGLPVQVKQTQKMVGNQMKPMYEFEMVF